MAKTMIPPAKDEYSELKGPTKPGELSAPAELGEPTEATEAEETIQRKAPDELAFEKRVKKAISYLASANLPAFAALMQVGEIICVPAGDQSVPTACLAKEGAGYKIYMNVGFCGQFNTPELAGILLHECLHHVFRHLEAPQFPDHKLANIIYDAFINRTIFHLEPTLIGWARKFYDESKSPELFLRPRSKPADAMDKQMYRHLYKGSLTETDLYDYLQRKLPRQQVIEVILVGSGEQMGEGGGGEPGDEGDGPKIIIKSGDSKNPLEKEAVPELVRDLRSKLRNRNTKMSGKLAGHFDQLLHDFIRINKLDRNATLEEAFRLSLVDTVKADLLNEVLGSVQDQGSQSVLMPEHPTRHDMIQVAMGMPMIFWQNPDYMEKQGDVRVYVDVSGSVSSYQDWIYGVILSLEEYLYTNIYLFSNKVVEITVGEFAQGKVDSTGGTGFDCVLNHILENKVEKAVIVTDGYASAPADLIQKVKDKNVDIFSVIIGEGDGYRGSYYKEGVKSFSTKIFELPRK